jgi:hypothetical protein
MVFAKAGSSARLQSSRWDEAIFLMIPGTSYLATIELCLRDKNHPIDVPRINSCLSVIPIDRLQPHAIG